MTEKKKSRNEKLGCSIMILLLAISFIVGLFPKEIESIGRNHTLAVILIFCVIVAIGFYAVENQ